MHGIWTHPALLLAVGGGLGANARYWLGRWVLHHHGEPGGFPLATFTINVAGSLLLGIVAALCPLPQTPRTRFWLVLVGTGFCGGFTTFSAFSLELLALVRQGRVGLALIYSLGSCLAGFAAVCLAVWATEKAAGR